jgi:hypothetical protein
MSARKHSASFGHALVAGIVLSLVAAAVLAALSPFLGVGATARAVVAGAGLAYVIYLIGRSGERVGRLATVALWCAGAAMAWLAGLPFAVYVLVHVGLVWLVRSLYYYAGLLPALVDLGLCALGLAFGVWAAQRTGSAWIAFWCFFLAQAFHTLIPATFGERAGGAPAGDTGAFARAHRAAEAAVRRLSTAR